MRKKMYWGLASLILIIGVAGVYFMLQPEPEPEKKFIVPSEADLEQAREAKQPPREAKEGFTWEWHADHWHEVPIAQNETPSGHPVQENQSEKPEFTGPLTYHKKLLESNPVEALRLQAEERGHWSAEWIPTFEPGDQEAESIAYSLYLCLYYESIGDKGNPIYKKAGEEFILQLRAINDHPSAKRRLDLLRLTWTDLPPEESVTRVSSSNHTLPLK